MRDRFFTMYQSIKYKECFYSVNQRRAYKRYWIYSVLLIAISLLCALVWSISKTQPIIWAIIIGIAQLAQALSPFLAWSKQLTALKYLLPKLSSLLSDIDSEWMNIDSKKYSDSKIQLLITNFDRQFLELENQFAEDITFCEKKSVLMSAESRSRDYFYLRYPIIKDLEERG